MNKIITFFSKIAQAVKIYEKITIIIQICHRDKFYFTCISGPWYLIMGTSMKKIHPTIIEECTRTDGLTDGLTDWTLSYIPRFCLGGAGNNKDTNNATSVVATCFLT